MLTPLQPSEIAALPARDRIVETAMRLFYRDGIRATGIDRIIAESGVAKMSFYRHFESKSDLVCAFLEERHRRWMAWFDATIEAGTKLQGGSIAAIAPALEDWFRSAEFRGCAFINAAAELTDRSSREFAIAVDHKRELEARLAAFAASDGCGDPADVGRLALVIVEGAIVRAQMTGSSMPARDAGLLLQAIVATGKNGAA